MKIGSDLTPNAFRANPSGGSASRTTSFSELLADGRSVESIARERSFGFSETGLFGAYGRDGHPAPSHVQPILDTPKASDGLVKSSQFSQAHARGAEGNVSGRAVAEAVGSGPDVRSTPAGNPAQRFAREGATGTVSARASVQVRALEASADADETSMPQARRSQTACEASQPSIHLSGREGALALSIVDRSAGIEKIMLLKRAILSAAYRLGVTIRRLVVNGKSR